MSYDVSPGGGTTHHASLDDVTTDQHHAKGHAADHATGQPDPVTAAAIGAATTGHGHAHSATTGQTVDDHHARDHASRHNPGGADSMGLDAALAAARIFASQNFR